MKYFPIMGSLAMVGFPERLSRLGAQERGECRQCLRAPSFCCTARKATWEWI